MDLVDQVYWEVSNPLAVIAHYDTDCQSEPNRTAVLALQLQDLAPNDARSLYDPADWDTGKASGLVEDAEVSYVAGASAVHVPLKILGNIRVVITDRKMIEINDLSLPELFKAEVLRHETIHGILTFLFSWKLNDTQDRPVDTGSRSEDAALKYQSNSKVDIEKMIEENTLPK